MKGFVKDPEKLDDLLLKILLEESLKPDIETLSTKEEINRYLHELKKEIEKDESTNRS